jgi:hypothetical protein
LFFDECASIVCRNLFLFLHGRVACCSAAAALSRMFLVIEELRVHIFAECFLDIGCHMATQDFIVVLNAHRSTIFLAVFTISR